MQTLGCEQIEWCVANIEEKLATCKKEVDSMKEMMRNLSSLIQNLSQPHVEPKRTSTGAGETKEQNRERTENAPGYGTGLESIVRAASQKIQNVVKGMRKSIQDVIAPVCM